MILTKEKEYTKNPIPDYEQLFQEAEDEERKKASRAIPKMLLKQNAFALLVSSFLHVMKSIGSYVIPLITAEIINIISRNDPNAKSKLVIYAIIITVIYLTNYPLHVIYSRHLDKRIRTLGAGLRNTLIRKLQHLSITYHKEIESGKIQAKFLRDIEATEDLSIQFSKVILVAVINTLIAVIISAVKSRTVTIFFMLVIPVNVTVTYLFRRPIRSSNQAFRKENENISSNISDMLDMIPVTKAHGLEENEIHRLEGKIDTLRQKSLAIDKINAKFASITWIAGQMMSLVCLLFTAYLAIKGTIEVGDIVVYQSYFATISGSITSIINVYPQIAKGMDSMNSLSEIVLSDEVEQNAGKIRLRYVHGTIRFDNVSFRYPNADKSIIKNLSFSVEPGECIAFVGASGSGKSTVMNMIIGFLKATEGSVYIDGKPIEKINLTDYRSFVSVVPQNCILFTGSIKDNITYGLTNVSDETLNEVIRLSNIDEFAKELPLGLDTPVGENGAKLSGGQKQRISIARALIRYPKILILDEATSALDNISEYQVQKAINHLIKGRTTFIVAHRLSTIRNADRIIVMDNGECVEAGTYDELMAKKGKFYELKILTEQNPEA